VQEAGGTRLVGAGDVAVLVGADELALTGQGAYDPFLGTSHLGILASPTTWAATLAFLTADKP